MEYVISAMSNELKAEIKQELHIDGFATKQESEVAKNELQKEMLLIRRDLEVMKLELQKEIEVVRKEIEVVRKEIAETSNKIIYWVVGWTTGLFVASGLIQHLFK